MLHFNISQRHINVTIEVHSAFSRCLSQIFSFCFFFLFFFIRWNMSEVCVKFDREKESTSGS